MMNAGGRRVQSLERAIDLLEALAASPGGLALGELARRAGLKAPTVHNLLRTLVARGYAAKGGPPVRYVLGPAAERLARGGRAEDGLARAGIELLALGRRWPAGRFTLAQPVAGDMAIRLRVAPGAAGVERPPGPALAPYASASALCWLAFADPEAASGYRLRHPFWEQGAAIWRTPERLKRALDGFRRAGGVRLRLRGEGLLKLAWPVRRGGALVGALGAALPAADADAAAAREIERALVEAAARLETADGETGREAGNNGGERCN